MCCWCLLAAFLLTRRPLACRAALQLGPFQPGVPVQPMIISYARNKRLDPCWVEPLGLPMPVVALRLLLQFHNYMEARRGCSGYV